MNNDATPSSAATGQPLAATSGSDGATAQADSPETVERNRKAGLGKKLQFMTHLMKSLDMVVFAEMCTLYYME